jgi:putative two-component system hydrogenase maturation factor HypX/HoxX
LYNKEVSIFGAQSLLNSVDKFFSGNFTPEPLNYNDPSVKGRLEPTMKKANRRIDWNNESTQKIISKIYAGDGAPGANAIINSKEFNLFGVHEV